MLTGYCTMCTPSNGQLCLWRPFNWHTTLHVCLSAILKLAPVLVQSIYRIYIDFFCKLHSCFRCKQSTDTSSRFVVCHLRVVTRQHCSRLVAEDKMMMSIMGRFKWLSVPHRAVGRLLWSLPTLDDRPNFGRKWHTCPVGFAAYQLVATNNPTFGLAKLAKRVSLSVALANLCF